MSTIKFLSIFFVISINNILYCNKLKLKHIINKSENNVTICIKSEEGDSRFLLTVAPYENITLNLPVNILKQEESFGYIFLTHDPLNLYETNIYIHPKIKHYYVAQIKSIENINNIITRIPINPHSKTNIYRNIPCQYEQIVFDLSYKTKPIYTKFCTNFPYSHYLTFEITDNCKLKVYTNTDDCKLEVYDTNTEILDQIEQSVSFLDTNITKPSKEKACAIM